MEKEAEWNKEKELRHVSAKNTVTQLCYKHLDYQVNNEELKNKSIDCRLLLLYTGMRCGELIALRWRDVDWEDATITIEKSASMTKNRNKKSEDVLVRIYQNSNFRNPDDLIAPTETGRMNTASNLEHRQKVIQKNAGLSYVEGGLHTFRKTFATWMFNNGARVEEVAAYIGDLASTTQKYYIAIRKKVRTRDGVKQIVRVPHNASWGSMEEEMEWTSC